MKKILFLVLIFTVTNLVNAQQQAQNIKELAPDGKTTYELHKVMKKHQYVLIDFWAAWCGPCRRENPNLVKAYHKFKNKGFSIYSVSLDKNASSWKNAIAKDKLSWKYHVSDLRGWESKPATTYRIYSIPSNYLIDSDGKIVGRNLRGRLLHSTLDKLLN